MASSASSKVLRRCFSALAAATAGIVCALLLRIAAESAPAAARPKKFPLTTPVGQLRLAAREAPHKDLGFFYKHKLRWTFREIDVLPVLNPWIDVRKRVRVRPDRGWIQAQRQIPHLGRRPVRPRDDRHHCTFRDRTTRCSTDAGRPESLSS